MTTVPFPSTSTVNANTFVGGDPNAATNPVFVQDANVTDRREISAPYVLGDYKAVFDDLSQTTGKLSEYLLPPGSAVNYDTLRFWELETQSEVGGSYTMIQSRQTHPYYSGQPQVVEFTIGDFATSGQADIIKRAGYYSHVTVGTPNFTADSVDGIYFHVDETSPRLRISRENVAGNVIDVAQAGWDDPLTGGGASGETIVWEDMNTFRFEFTLHGSVVVKFYWYKGGEKILFHTYTGVAAGEAFCASPNQPVLFEIYNGPSSGSAETMRFYNAQVSTSNDISKYSGQKRAIHRNLRTAKTQAVTEGDIIPLIGIRLKSTVLQARNACVHILQYSASNQSLNALYTVILMRNPVFVGTATAWTDYSPRGLIQVGLANEVPTSIDTTVTKDLEKVVASYSGGGSNGDKLDIPVRLSGAIDLAVEGTDEYWVCVVVQEPRGYYTGSLDFMEVL